jgi:mRNA interferase RelE/StbE
MASFSVIFQPSVHRDLRILPKPMVARVLKRIEQLRSDPLPRQSLKLSLAENLFRVRVGDYRIVYEVDSKRRQITIYYVRHRRDVYRNL